MIKIYRERRDYFCKLLKDELGEYISFEVPKGGMAVWVILDKKFSWTQVEEEAKKHKLLFIELKRYDMAHIGHNGIRIGFARYTPEEAQEFVSRFKKTIEIIESRLN